LATAGLAATASVVMLSGPVPALGVTQPGDSPCLASTGSLTLSSSTIHPGQTVSASWTTQRPRNCEGMVSQLNGPGASLSGGVGGTGTLTPPNMGVNTYTVTVFYPGGSVDVDSESVTVQRWPTSITNPANMCVDVRGGNSANGTPVQLWTCNGTAEQQLTTQPDGTIHVLGKCLDVSGNGIASGTAVQLQDCNGFGGETWATSSQALVNPASGRCLDSAGGNTAAGTPLQISDCNAAASQRWTLPTGSSLPAYSGNENTTFQSTGSGAAPFPIITCSQGRDTPTVVGDQVVGDASATCDHWMIELKMFDELSRDGVQAGDIGYDETEGLPDVHVTARATCKAGYWVLWAETFFAPPPGFLPSEELIYPGPNSLHTTYISESQCTPVLVSMSDSDARAEVSKLDLELGTVTMRPNNNVPFGHVIAPSLESDDKTVDLVESEGNDTVPDLKGDVESYAISDIGEDGLVLGTVTMRDDCISKGDVESQTPDAGTYFDPANPPTVNITVSDCSTIPK
jgi:hypothetical protein